MRTLKFVLLIIGTVLCATSPVLGVCNNDGTMDTGEQCDDGNLISNDGCTNCTLDIRLDLNSTNPSSTNGSREFFELDQVEYFTEPGGFSLYVNPLRNWTRIVLAMIDDNPPVDDEIDVFTRKALRDGRLAEDFSGLFSRSQLVPFDPRLRNLPVNIDTSRIREGMIVRGDDNFPFGDGDENLSEREAQIVLSASGYIAREHPGYNPRYFCIIADDSVSTATSCITLYFIGLNDDAPVIIYTPRGMPSFVEGQTEFIPIVTGFFNITDQDHPRYLQMYAEVRIMEFVTGYPEIISVSTLNPDFTYSLDENLGFLNISGPGTPEQYEMLLSHLTYFNNMTEPVGASRQIQVVMSDGNFQSRPAIVNITIVNTNDDPAISLIGEDPIIYSLMLNYTEGSGSVVLVPDLTVVDVDPNPMIQRVTVRIVNPVDGNLERLDLSSSDTMGLNFTTTGQEIILLGVSPVSVYTTVVQRVTYQHLSAAPGNPTTNEVRMIEFYVEDNQGGSSLRHSTIQLSIIPINDAPILFFIPDATLRDSPQIFSAGNRSLTFQYTEDDTPLYFGRYIYLRDVDSNIISATLQLTNLLNGMEDLVNVDSALLGMHNVMMLPSDTDFAGEASPETDTDGGSSRVITFIGEASPQAYETILRSLTYRNLHTTNQVEDGRRTIRITVNDTEHLSSQEITAHIDVGDRNDAPSINIGAGNGMDLNLTFQEEGASIPIVLSHLVSIMDEENHNISRLTAHLISTNGKLDPSDAIFLRSPLGLQFTDDFRIPPTTRLIDISLNASRSTYRDALLSIHYDNAEREPTLFNTMGSPLIREVIITVYDDNFLSVGASTDQSSNFDNELGVSQTVLRVGITIEPMNDNAPRILIRVEPEGCAVGSSGTGVGGGEGGLARRRRDVKAASGRIRKRSLNFKVDDSKSPKVTSVFASYNSECLDTITISFSTNTSVPVVETSQRLGSILSFDSPVLNSAHKFGVWLDYQTLVVVFTGCIEMKDDGTKTKERPVYLYFEAERENCDWTSICKYNTICFSNETGCPVSGTYKVNMNGSCRPGEECHKEPNSHGYDASFDPYRAIILSFLLIAMFVTVPTIVYLFYIRNCSTRRKSGTDLTGKDSSDSTAIEMSPAPQKVVPIDEIGPQDLIITIPPPLPPCKAEANRKSSDSKPTEGKLKESSDQRQRKKKRRRKTEKRDVPHNEDGEMDILIRDDESSEGDEEKQGGVVTALSPERSHDQSCDSSPSNNATPLTKTGGDSYHVPNPSREHSLNLSNEGATQISVNPQKT